MADSSHSTLFKGLEMGDIKVKNSRGSSAGAGSGDCHHYLQGRREEIFRLERLAEDSKKAKLDKEWQEQLDARKAEAEAERAKKAAKRNKKKQKRQAGANEDSNNKKTKVEEDETEEVHKLKAPEDKEETKETSNTAETEAKVKTASGIIISDD